jgi:hypothetical protein
MSSLASNTSAFSFDSYRYDIQETSAWYKYVRQDIASKTIVLSTQNTPGYFFEEYTATPASAVTGGLALCDPWVVWVEGSNIMASDSAGSTPILVRACDTMLDPEGPRVEQTSDGHYIVVWSECDNGPNFPTTWYGYDVKGYDLTTGISFDVAVGDGVDLFADVSGDWIIWRDNIFNGPPEGSPGTHGNGLWAVDVVHGGTPFQVLPAPTITGNAEPSISGDWVVWQNGYQGIQAGPVQALNLRSGWWGAVTLMGPQGGVRPQIDGQTIVWTQKDAESVELHAFQFPDDEGGPDVLVDTSGPANSFSLHVTDELGVYGVKYEIVPFDGVFLGNYTHDYSYLELTITAPSAGCTVYWQATDVSGNVTTGAQELLDTTPPTCTATVSPVPNGASWNNSDVTVTLTADGTGSAVDSVKYRLHAADSWTDYTAPIPVSGHGTTFVYCQVKDAAGNTYEPANPIKYVNIDYDAPSCSASVSPTPNGAGWNSSDVTVTLTASDTTSYVASKEYKLGSGGTWTTYPAGGIPVSSTTDVYCRATDAAGNTYTSPSPLVVQIDKTAPAVSFATPTPNAVYTIGSTQTSTGTVSDGGSGVAQTIVKNDSVTKPSTTSGWSFALDTATTGPHTFQAVATDLAGNTSTSNVTYTVGTAQDTTPPDIWNTNIAIQNNTSLPLYDSNKPNEGVSLDFGLMDNAGVSVSSCWIVVTNDKGSSWTYTASDLTATITDAKGDHGGTTGIRPELSGAEAVYTVTLHCKDWAGNDNDPNYAGTTFKYTVVGTQPVLDSTGFGVTPPSGSGDIGTIDVGSTSTNNLETVTLEAPGAYTFPAGPDLMQTLGVTDQSNPVPALMTGLKPRLYIINPKTGQILYKAPTLFTESPAGSGHWTYTFDRTPLYQYLPADNKGILLRHVIVLVDGTMAPVAVLNPAPTGNGEGPGGGGSPGKKPKSSVQLTAATTDTDVVRASTTTKAGALGIQPLGKTPAPTFAVTAWQTSVAITSGTSTTISIDGSVFGTGPSATNWVKLRGIDNAMNVAWYAATQGYTATPAPNAVLGCTWGASRVTINTPPYTYGNFYLDLQAGSATKSKIGMATAITYASATVDWRYLRRS